MLCDVIEIDVENNILVTQIKSQLEEAGLRGRSTRRWRRWTRRKPMVRSRRRYYIRTTHR